MAAVAAAQPQEAVRQDAAFQEGVELGLCNVAYTATQYALLSSLATVGRTTLSAGGGWLSLQLDWPLFFVATTVAALPGLVMAVWVMRRFPPPAQPAPARPGSDDP